MPSQSDDLKQLETILQSGSLDDALSFLNRRVPHRYTGIFHFSPPLLSNRVLSDGWDPGAPLLDDAPLEQTFCGLVRNSGEPLLSNDVRREAALLAGPLRDSPVAAYCGVPLFDSHGKGYGTLCHWDTKPCTVGPQEVDFLQQAATLISPAAKLS